MTEWFEDESFWIGMYPLMFPEGCFEVAEEQVDKILKLIGFHPRSVLDLCCGPGRHSLALARRGIKVTAVDRTRFLLEKARERATAIGAEVEFVQEDMRRFVRPGGFDLVLSMFGSFGYFDDKRDDLLVLRNMHESLKASGASLVDVLGKELVAHHGQPAIAEQPGGALFVGHCEIFDDWTRVRNEWILIKDGQARSFKFHITIYSGQELKDLLQRAGFATVGLFGDLDGSPYGPSASRLVALARKAA